MSDQLSLLDPATPAETAAAVVAQRTGRTHRADPVTSLAAAVGVKSGTQRFRALLALVERDMTGHEVAEFNGHPLAHVYTTRLADLVEARCVELIGEIRPTPLGRTAQVYRITEVGRAVLAELEAL